MTIRDAALLGATDYVANEHEWRQGRHTDGTPVQDRGGRHGTKNASSGGLGIGGWICLGLFVLLTIWLIVGLDPRFIGGGGCCGYGGGGGWGWRLGLRTFCRGSVRRMAGMWLYGSS